LLVAQRNYYFYFDEIQTLNSKELYKGLYGWLTENREDLLSQLYENSGVFGEWIGMGKIGYPNLENRFHVFAKARINDDIEIFNIVYKTEFLKYAFTEQVFPSYMNMVTIIGELEQYPNVKELDEIYEWYCDSEQRKVEGFIINNNNEIKKYVRYKNGKLEAHKS
jgi:hypothetical protein